MKIAIDIGHANGTGARGGGHEEHEVAAKLAILLQNELEKKGLEAVIIDFPWLDNRQDLNKTIEEANHGGYELGISLHLDSASKIIEEEENGILVQSEVPNPIPHGAHVCYYPASKKGKRLASLIAAHLSKVLPGRAETTVARSNLAVLKKTRPTWVLCECGFITNPADLELVLSCPGKVVGAIVSGVEEYIS